MKPDAPGAEPALYVGIGAKTDEKGKRLPPDSMDAIKKAITDGVREGKTKVVLEADGAVPHGTVLKVAAAVSDVEGATLHIGVQEAH